MELARSDCCPHCFSLLMQNGRCLRCGWDNAQLESHPVAGALPPFTTLKQGAYLLGHALGAGGFGITYITRPPQGDVRYAIKEYYPASCAVRAPGARALTPTGDTAAYQSGMEKFGAEARTLVALNKDPYIVRAVDYFQENNTAYLVMEYIDGPNLSQYVQSLGSRPLGQPQAVQMLAQTAMALQGVHGAGIIHRDISPENILLCHSGDVCLIDFGAARDYVHRPRDGQSVFLKKRFAPPEQYSNQERQGPYTDLYALGATFYHLLTRTYVPSAPDRLSGVGYTPISALRPDVELWLAALLDKCLALEPARRYASASELVADIYNRTTARPDEKLQNAMHKALTRHPPAAPPTSPTPPAQPAAPVRGPAEHGFYLEVLTGAEAGQRYWLPTGQPVLVGRRAAECQVVISGAGISRQHCIVQIQDGQGGVTVRDTSTNGTFYESGAQLVRGLDYPMPLGQPFYLADRGHTVRILYQ